MALNDGVTLFVEAYEFRYPFERLTEIFIEKASYLRAYEGYTSEYAAAFNLARNLQKLSLPLRQFVRVREFCIKKKLDQLMSTPIQRSKIH